MSVMLKINYINAINYSFDFDIKIKMLLELLVLERQCQIAVV